MTGHRRLATRLAVALAASLLAACAPAPSPSEASPVAIVSQSPSATEAPSASSSPSAPSSPTATPTATTTPSPTPAPTPVPSIVKCPGTPTRQGTIVFPYTAEEFVAYATGRPSAKITCVEATWTQPTVACTTKDQRFAISIAIDGWTSSRLRVNVPFPRRVSVGTETDCIKGKPVISAWYEANPTKTFQYFNGLEALYPAVGDIIWAQIRFANGKFTMSLRDKTTGVQVSVSQVVPKIARVAAVWEVSSVFTDCAKKCRPTGIAKFSPITFSSAFATMNGKRVAIGGAGVADCVEDATKNGVRRMVVSRLSGTGHSFKVTWKHT